METIIENLRKLYEMNREGFDAILKPFGLILVSDGDSFYSATPTGPAPVRTVRESDYSIEQFTALGENYYVDFSVKLDSKLTPYVSSVSASLTRGNTLCQVTKAIKSDTDTYINILLPAHLAFEINNKQGVRLFKFVNTQNIGRVGHIDDNQEILQYLSDLNIKLPGILNYIKAELPSLEKTVEAAQSSVGRTIQPIEGTIKE